MTEHSQEQGHEHTHGNGHEHGHGHEHEHGHDHTHGHEHTHGHDHAHNHEDVQWDSDQSDGTMVSPGHEYHPGFSSSNTQLYTEDIEVDEHGVATASAILEALKAVIDPEIGIDIVNLGLIYDVAVSEGVAYVIMTLTTIGCPLSELLHTQVTLVCNQMPGIHAADVEFTFSPPWSTDMLSEDARLELRAMGMNV